LKIEDIKTVLIIGSGTMGQQIGFQCAAHGYDVVLHDISQKLLDNALISESVPEDPELKGKVLARFNEICPVKTIFTTNTSSLLPSMFAEATGRPARFAAFHFHDTRFNNIVDIMPHPGTSSETMALIENFARRIGLVPIVMKKENNGYVFNAMLMELLKSAQSLAANGVTPPAGCGPGMDGGHGYEHRTFWHNGLHRH
jgi:3-hydroxybutyryl-CoA dehydrogenase